MSRSEIRDKETRECRRKILRRPSFRAHQMNIRLCILFRHCKDTMQNHNLQSPKVEKCIPKSGFISFDEKQIIIQRVHHRLGRIIRLQLACKDFAICFYCLFRVEQLFADFLV